MKPEFLTLKGFLSYRQKQTLDFSKFHIALISGDNGNGKSSLLDGITFALYSMARGVEGNKKGIVDLVSNGDTNLFAQLIFEQSNRIYRVTRTYDAIKRISNVILETENDAAFKNISENSLRETDDKIKDILRMDYDTFLTSSFIMQGKSDYFTSKNPTEKIEILREMLMLDVYEKAREIAKEEIKEINAESKGLSQRIEETKGKLQEKEELSLRLKEILNALHDENENLSVLKKEMEVTNERLLEKKSIVEKIKNSSSNITRLSDELSRVKALVETKSEEKTGLFSILQSQEEIEQGFGRLIAIKNRLSEMIEKSLEIEKLNREKDNLQARLDTEISNRKQELLQNQNRVRELEREIDNDKNLIGTRELELSNCEEENKSVAEKEKTLYKEIALSKTKIEELNDQIRLKKALEGRLKEVQSIRIEREKSIEKENLLIKEQLRKIEEGINSTNIKELEEQFIKADNTINAAFEKIKQAKELSNQKMLINKDIQAIKENVNEINDKILLLSSEGIGHCPLCGAELSENHREKLLEDFYKEKADKEALLANFNEQLFIIDGGLKDYSQASEENYASLKKERDYANVKLEKAKEDISKWRKQKKELLEKLDEFANKVKNVLSDDEQEEADDILDKLKASSYMENLLEDSQKKELLLEKDFAELQIKSKELLQRISSLKSLLLSSKENNSSKSAQMEKLIERKMEIEKELAEPSFMADIKNGIAEIIKKIELKNFNEDELNNTRMLKEKLSIYEERHDKLKEASVKIVEIDKALTENGNRLDSIEREIAKEKWLLQDLQSSLGKLKDIEIISEEIKKKIVFKEDSIKVINETKVRFQEKIKEIEELEAKSKQFENKLMENNEKRQILEICSEMFGKEGIPIAVIRSILPQIEAFSNDLLLRMTSGGMQVKFQTLKDSKSGEKSTLQIDVYDNGQRRRYELFSGGEQFRINLAIRIGISLFLSSAANTPLETLVIDEGFGSQDEAGKEHILYEINAIKDQFKKVLIISHVGDIKENFPYEIRVIKDQNGSHLNIL